MSDSKLGYVASRFVTAAPSQPEQVILNYSGTSDDPPVELDNFLSRFTTSKIQRARIVAYADQTASGAPRARIVKVEAALEKKGVGRAIIDIEPLSVPSSPAQLSQVKVTLLITNPP
jgi:hypothetical protein